MTDDPSNSLRRRAETVLASQPREVPDDATLDKARRLVHELRTHQIELELQNEELRQAQLELEESRQRLVDLYDFAPVGYVTVSAEGSILEANLTLASMLGVTRDNLLTSRLGGLVAPPEQDVFYAHRRQVSQHGRVAECDLQLLRADGTSFHAHLRSAPLQEEGDTPTAWRSAVVDISGRKQAEDALRQAHDELEQRIARRTAELVESEGRYRRLVDGSPGILYVFSDKRGGVFYSPQVETVLGCSGEHLLQHPFLWNRSIHPDDIGRVQTAIANAGADGGFEVEYRLKTARGDWVWLHDGCLGVRHEGEEAIIEGLATDITERKHAEEALRHALTEVQGLREKLEAENVYLREEVKWTQNRGDIVGSSAAIRGSLVQATQVADADTTVLILGETGVGKELLAQTIHDAGPRKHRPLVKVNCATLPATLIEAELFGREKGAYTGALTKQVGRFELADGSSIFLDEIGDLPTELQVKLLRVLQTGEFERLGSPKTIKVDVRVIAATNRDLQRAVRDGSFRQDLFYRLNVFPITVPPLRERREDIPQLVWTFVTELGERMGKRIDHIPRKALDAFQQHDWPGNVRELRNAIERAMIMTAGSTLRVELPQAHVAPTATAPKTLQDVERQHILRVLREVGWRVGGPGGAAAILGLDRTTLQSRMKKLGIQRPASA